MAIRLATLHCVVLPLLAVLAPAAAPPSAPGEYQIRDGDSVRTFIVSSDELSFGTRPGQHRVEKIDTASAEAVQRMAAIQRDREKVELILYEKGCAKDLAHRRWLRGRVLAMLQPGADPATLAKACGADSWETRRYFPGGMILSFSGDPAAALRGAEALRRMPAVKSADPILARVLERKAFPNDPLFRPTGFLPFPYYNQWYLNAYFKPSERYTINVENVWGTVDGNGVRIGIIDDGVALDHPDLAANADRQNHFDWVDHDTDPTPDPARDFHGTACAGLAAARGDNGVGITGTAPMATLVGLRLTSQGNPVDDALAAEAVAWKNDAIHIKNFSWGAPDDGASLDGPGPLTKASMADAVTNGRRGRGTIIVTAAGNGREAGDDSNADGWANAIEVIAVSASAFQGPSAIYSERGANILLSAPSSDNIQANLRSVEIVTTDLAGAAGANAGGGPGAFDDFTDPDYTRFFEGTSAAAALVSGACALILQSNPNLGWRDVKEILMRAARGDSGDDIDVFNGAGFGFSYGLGSGKLNVQPAVQLARVWPGLPPMETRTYPLPDLNDTAIPDQSPPGVTRTVTVPSTVNMRVEQVQLDVEVQHPHRGDLEITIISPANTSVRVLSPRPLDGHAHLTWTLSTPFFWGEPARGNWTVRVADTVANHIGSWTSASLKLHGAALPPAPVIPDSITVPGVVDLPLFHQMAAGNFPDTFWPDTVLPWWIDLHANTGLVSGSPPAAGTYTFGFTARNRAGVRSETFTVEVNAGADATASALNGGGLTWTSGGTAPWQPDGYISHDHAISMRSGNMGNNQESWLQTTVSGPDRISWRWRASSEAVADTLSFVVDGTPQNVPAPLSGESGWKYVSYQLTPGPHTLRWRYQKDVSLASGRDAAWLDEVFVDGLQPEPRVTSPLSATGAVGAFFSYQITGSRNPRAFYSTRLPQGLSMDAAGHMSGIPAEEGTYPVTLGISGATGASTALLALTIVPSPHVLAEGGDRRGTSWAHTVPSDAWWFSQADRTHDGADALQSGPIRGGQQSQFSINVTGPGTLTFWWAVSSQPTFDRMELLLDGALRNSLSGEKDWQQATLNVPAGNRVITWRYLKNATINAGSDAAWVDEIAFAPADSDQDGLPDAWEQLHFGSLTATADGDEDGDGQRNGTEYFTGTLPRDGTSLFVITAAQHLPPGSISLAWPGAGGRLYSLQSSLDLQTWTDLPGVISAGSAGARVILPHPPAPAARSWWRVVAQ